MLNINFQNVEELVFQDINLMRKLTNYEKFFHQWKLSKISPHLKQTEKKALLDFLNSFKSDDLIILENYFNDKVEIKKLNYDLVKNIQTPLYCDDICETLNDIDEFVDLSIYTDRSKLYITLWR